VGLSNTHEKELGGDMSLEGEHIVRVHVKACMYGQYTYIIRWVMSVPEFLFEKKVATSMAMARTIMIHEW
jgi:hypothetical protein